MTTLTFIRTELVLVGLSLIFGVPWSRRVLTAWTAWAWCRWTWRHERSSVRRWLWIKTLRFADGRPNRAQNPRRGS